MLVLSGLWLLWQGRKTIMKEWIQGGQVVEWTELGWNRPQKLIFRQISVCKRKVWILWKTKQKRERERKEIDTMWPSCSMNLVELELSPPIDSMTNRWLQRIDFLFYFSFDFDSKKEIDTRNSSSLMTQTALELSLWVDFLINPWLQRE